MKDGPPTLAGPQPMRLCLIPLSAFSIEQPRKRMRLGKPAFPNQKCRNDQIQ
jgi:hypothetical protein